MGYYIETGTLFDKAKIIASDHGGVIATFDEAKLAMKDPSKGVIVVVRNPQFEAAAFAYDEDEFNAFHYGSDPRPRTYVILDRRKAEHLSGFAPTLMSPGDSMPL